MPLQDLTPQLRTRLSRVEKAVGWWALSGAAVLLERLTREPFEFKVEDNEAWDAAEKQGKAG